MEYEQIRFEVEDGVATITLNRPEQMNAFTGRMGAEWGDALARCADLGFRRFNAALGDVKMFVHESWIDAPAMAAWLAGLPHDANSGDVYAMR